MVKPRSSLALLSLGALAVLAAGGLWLRPAPPAAPTAGSAAAVLAPPPAPAPPRRCAWEPGRRASYAGSHLLDSSFHLGASPTITTMAQGQEIPEQKSRVATTWQLDTEVEDVDARGSAIVAMRFRSFQVKEAEQASAATIPGMDTPFLVRLSPRCEIEDFARRDTQDLDTAFQQQQTIASFQWRHAEDGSPRYRAHERDSMGEFSAQYELVGQDRLRRQRRLFDSLYGSHPQGEVPVGRAHGPGQTVTLGQDPWFVAIEQDETLTLTLHDKTLATLALRGKVEAALAPERTAAMADPRAPGWVWGWLLGHHSPSMNRDKEPPVDPELARLSVPQMLERFSQLLGNEDVNVYVNFLARWIRSNPQRLGELVTALRGGKFPEKYGHSAVFLALSRAGTDEARRALLDITQGRAWKGADRQRAALALVEAGTPLGPLETTLRDGARKEPEVYASVLGQAIRMQENKDPNAAQRMRETLGDLLADASTSSRQGQMLTAVRNSADPSFIPQVRGLARSSDPDVRIDAYQALGSMPGNATEQDFLEALRQESDPRVRAAMVRAYTMQATLQGGVSPALLAAAAAALATEPNADVRGELVAMLGDAARKKNPLALDALRTALHVELARPDEERNVRLLQLLGSFLGTSSKARG